MCKHLDFTIERDKGQRCSLKSQDDLTMNEIAAKHNEMGVGGSFDLNEMCPFDNDDERKKCPWFEK